MHEPGSGSQQRQKRFSLKDVPPLITAIAALITALVAAAAFLAGRATGPSQPSSSTRPTGQAGQTQAPSTPTGGTTSPSAIRWAGPLRVDSVDLDTIPPTIGDGGAGDIAFSEENSNPGIYGIYTDNKVVLWTRSGEPSKSQCTNLAETEGAAGASGLVSVEKGSVVCVMTSDGRTARLEVTEATAEDAAAGFVKASVTVWQ